MGTYIYTLRHDTKLIEVNGTMRLAAPIRFSHKFSPWGNSRSVRRAAASWEGLERPEFAVVSSKQRGWKDGDYVYWMRGGYPTETGDTPTFAGVLLGELAANVLIWAPQTAIDRESVPYGLPFWSFHAPEVKLVQRDYRTVERLDGQPVPYNLPYRVCVSPLDLYLALQPVVV